MEHFCEKDFFSCVQLKLLEPLVGCIIVSCARIRVTDTQTDRQTDRKTHKTTAITLAVQVPRVNYVDGRFPMHVLPMHVRSS